MIRVWFGQRSDSRQGNTCPNRPICNPLDLRTIRLSGAVSDGSDSCQAHFLLFLLLPPSQRVQREKEKGKRKKKKRTGIRPNCPNCPTAATSDSLADSCGNSCSDRLANRTVRFCPKPSGRGAASPRRARMELVAALVRLGDKCRQEV